MPPTELPAIFAEVWKKDPNRWARDCFFDTPSDWQTDFLEAVGDPRTRRVALRGARGCGKSTVLALTLLWRLTTRPGSLTIACTAVERQMRLGLWAEVKRLWASSTLLRKLFPGWQILSDRIETGDPSWRGLALSSDAAWNLEGAHGRSVAVLIDEARALDDAFYTSLQAIITGDDSLLVVAGTAGPPMGFFYRIFARDGRDRFDRLFTIRADESSDPDLRARFDSERARLGENDPVFRAEWLGDFVATAESGIFSLAMLEAVEGFSPDESTWLDARMGLAHSRSVVLGCDVARTGDSNVVAILRGQTLERFEDLGHCETMETAGKISALARLVRAQDVAIDGVGIGDGVYSRVSEILEPYEIAVHRFIAGAKAFESDRYADRKTELAFVARKAIEDRELGLPRSERLRSEMLAVTSRIMSNGRVRIVDPRESPDYLDAALIALSVIYGPPPGIAWGSPIGA